MGSDIHRLALYEEMIRKKMQKNILERLKDLSK